MRTCVTYIMQPVVRGVWYLCGAASKLYSPQNNYSIAPDVCYLVIVIPTCVCRTTGNNRINAAVNYTLAEIILNYIVTHPFMPAQHSVTAQEVLCVGIHNYVHHPVLTARHHWRVLLTWGYIHDDTHTHTLLYFVFYYLFILFIFFIYIPETFLSLYWIRAI